MKKVLAYYGVVCYTKQVRDERLIKPNSSTGYGSVVKRSRR